jgi:hypothetical protein
MMITTEAEIRVALQAVLVTVLALYGFWGCALVVLVILLPWKPLLAVGGYLAQPVVDWRLRKARDRHEDGIAQIERELDDILRTEKSLPASAGPSAPAGQPPPPAPVPETKAVETPKPTHPPTAPPSTIQYEAPPLRLFQASPPTGSAPPAVAAPVQDLADTLAILPAIQSHVRNLPQGAFSNMDLEVERIEFRGNAAEAYVKFHSPNVPELVVRQRYDLRKAGEHWQVESRQPTNGSGNLPPRTLPTPRPPMRLN